MKIIVFIIFSFFYFISTLQAQENAVVIHAIVINGNTKTKESIVLRQLSFKKGDTIRTDELADQCIENRNRNLDTGLFTRVKIYLLK